MGAEPPPPDRLTRRAGIRPGTGFGRDDADIVCEPLMFRAPDGPHWDALLARPRGGHPGRDDTLVIVVHGSMGNYVGGVPRRATFELARAGYAALSVNTRMANFGPVYGGGVLDHAVRDLEGAVGLGRELGYRRMILLGHSLGAVLACNFQAATRPPEVVGLAALAPPSDLRESLAWRWERNGAEPGIERVEELCREVGADREDGGDDLVIVRRGSGPTDAPADAEVWSLRCWWRSRGPGVAAARAVESVGRAGVPVLLVGAEADEVIPGHHLTALADAARDGGVPLTTAEVPGADHSFWGLVPRAVAHVVTWADSLEAPEGPRPAPPDAGPDAVLVTVRSPDGLDDDALLHRDERAMQARVRRTGRRTAVVHLHGNQGNFSVGALRWMHGPVAATGVPVLSLETRLGNVSQIFGGALLSDAVRDVEGAIGFLASEGYDAVVLSGYSLGAVLAVRAAAGPLELELRGVVGLSTSEDMPAATRRRMDLCAATPSYAEMVELTRPVSGRPQDDFPVVVRRAFLPRDTPRAAGAYTARTWWHSRGPAATDAQPRRWIGRVGVPVLLVQGDADSILDPGEAAALQQHARAAGKDDVEVVMVAGADHSFAGHQDELIAAMSAFVDRVA